MEIKYEWRKCSEGGSTWLESIIAEAYLECKELQCTEYPITRQRIVEDTTQNTRWEYRCTIDGTVSTVAVITLDEDNHVGLCYGMQWCYTVPKYRGTGSTLKAYRGLRDLAKAAGLPYAYTKRIKEGEYNLVYKNYG